MDLSSFVVILKARQQLPPERTLPLWWGGAVHRLALKTLNLSDEVPELRPFTVSTLHGRFANRQLDLDAEYNLRFTGLNKAVTDSFVSAYKPGGSLAPGAMVDLDFLEFEVKSLYTEKGSHTLADSTNYQDLLSASLLDPEPAPRRVSFHFASATAFMRNGKTHPYPMPDLVFGNLLERWNAFAPVAFPAEAKRYAVECLVPRNFEIKSRTINVAGGIQTGFYGKVSFLAATYERYWMSLIHTLAQYSYYSSVGIKTAMGMGQCRKIVELPKPVQKTTQAGPSQ